VFACARDERSTFAATKSRAIDPAFLVMGIELGRPSNGSHRNNRRRPCLSRLQEVEEGKREVMADEDNGE